MFISEARNVGSVCYVSCSLAKPLPSEYVSLIFFSVLRLFCFEQVGMVEDLFPKMENPETFHIAKPIWFIFHYPLEYDLLFGYIKAD